MLRTTGFDEGPWLVLDPFSCFTGQYAQADAGNMVKDNAQEFKQRSIKQASGKTTPASTCINPNEVSRAEAMRFEYPAVPLVWNFDHACIDCRPLVPAAGTLYGYLKAADSSAQQPFHFWT